MIIGLFFLGLLLFFLFFKKAFVKKDFSPILAHELTSSITALQGFSEILLSETLNMENKNLALLQIQSICNKMHLIIENLLLLEKNLSLDPIDTSCFLEKVECEFLKRYAGKKLLIIKDPNVEKVVIHEKLFFLALFNLLENSVKYGKGPILLKVFKDKNKVRFSVQDRGVISSKKNLTSLFSRGACSEKGTGIGLYLVKKILEKHKGFVSVGSNKKTGTVFTISISN